VARVYVAAAKDFATWSVKDFSRYSGSSCFDVNLSLGPLQAGAHAELWA
jgi:hypothetical protein